MAKQISDRRRYVVKLPFGRLRAKNRERDMCEEYLQTEWGFWEDLRYYVEPFEQRVGVFAEESQGLATDSPELAQLQRTLLAGAEDAHLKVRGLHYLRMTTIDPVPPAARDASSAWAVVYHTAMFWLDSLRTWSEGADGPRKCPVPAQAHQAFIDACDAATASTLNLAQEFGLLKGL